MLQTVRLAQALVYEHAETPDEESQIPNDLGSTPELADLEGVLPRDRKDEQEAQPDGERAYSAEARDAQVRQRSSKDCPQSGPLPSVALRLVFLYSFSSGL